MQVTGNALALCLGRFTGGAGAGMFFCLRMEPNPSESVPDNGDLWRNSNKKGD